MLTPQGKYCSGLGHNQTAAGQRNVVQLSLGKKSAPFWSTGLTGKIFQAFSGSCQVCKLKADHTALLPTVGTSAQHLRIKFFLCDLNSLEFLGQ